MTRKEFTFDHQTPLHRVGALWCKVIFILTTHMLRHPYCDNVKLKELVGSPGPGSPLNLSREFNYYRIIGTKRYHVLAISIFYLLYSIKDTVLLLHLTMLYNHNEPELDFIKVTSDRSNETLGRFTCLETNCDPRLSRKLVSHDGSMNEVSLAHQLSQLPLFSICNYYTSTLYPPMKDMGNPGYLILGVLLAYTFSIGFLMPIVKFIHTTWDHVGMFVVAPTLTNKIAKDRIKLFVACLQTSLINYYYMREESRHSLGPIKSFPEVSYDSNQRYDYFPPGIHILPTGANKYVRASNARGSLKLFARKTQGKVKMEEFAEDCLPSTRTRWWHSRMSLFYCFVNLTGFYSVYGSFLVVYLFVFKPLLEKLNSSISEFAKETRKENCSLWYTHDSLRHPIDLSEFRIDSNLFNSIEILATLGYLLALGCIWYIYYWGFFLDIFALLEELFMQLEILTVCLKMRWLIPNSRHRSRRFERESALELAPKFAANVKSRFRKSLSFWIYFYTNKYPSQKLSTKRANQQFVIEQVANNCLDQESLIDLMEKTLISFKIFSEKVNNQATSISSSVICLHGVYYCYVIVATWLSKTLKDFRFEPLMMVFGFWLMSTIASTISSYFHATAKKLEPIIWNLVAAMRVEDDIRLEHLRLLWFKEVKTLDGCKEFSLSAFGIRITYVRSLQMTITTATLYVYLYLWLSIEHA